MRRLMFALALLIASVAPMVGVTTATADEPCVSVTTTSSAAWPLNQYVGQCVPVDIPPAGDSQCVYTNPELPPPGTLRVDVAVCFPA